MKYMVCMILSMILEAMDNASVLLKPGGFMCVKCKDYEGMPYTHEVM